MHRSDPTWMRCASRTSMGAVGRRRIRDKHLPQRVYLRSGTYWFAGRDGRWVKLGRSYEAALRELAGILGKASPANSVAELLERYRREELVRKAEKTRREREQQFQAVTKAFGHMQPEQIEPHHVWGFWEARGRTEQARHEVRALSALLTYARRTGVRRSPNPCFGLQLPGAAPRRRYVTDAEYRQVRALAPPMIRHAMDLAVMAGMDQATIRALERRHLTEDGIAFRRGKTGAEQLIEWSEALRALIRAVFAERPQLRQALICNRRGRPYSANGFQSQWQRVMRRAKKAGLAPFHFHDLRAKSASDALDDQSAADRLGHADPALTRRVYRRLPRRAEPLRILEESANIVPISPREEPPKGS